MAVSRHYQCREVDSRYHCLQRVMNDKDSTCVNSFISHLVYRLKNWTVPIIIHKIRRLLIGHKQLGFRR